MDRRKKGEYIGALGALLVHVAVIALLILVSFTVPQPDEAQPTFDNLADEEFLRCGDLR